MTNNIAIGKKGEDLAAAFLTKKGYKIVERNYRSGRGEIDLIAIWQNLLIFIEVKLRANSLYGYPEAAVKAHKKRMVTRTAGRYIRKINWKEDIRFDIVAITGEEIDHFEDAF